jgi:hypothetical protein
MSARLEILAREARPGDGLKCRRHCGATAVTTHCDRLEAGDRQQLAQLLEGDLAGDLARFAGVHGDRLVRLAGRIVLAVKVGRILLRLRATGAPASRDAGTRAVTSK